MMIAPPASGEPLERNVDPDHLVGDLHVLHRGSLAVVDDHRPLVELVEVLLDGPGVNAMSTSSRSTTLCTLSTEVRTL